MYDPPPVRPSESDCCGSGCVPCVLDVYDEELSRWERRRRTGNGDRLRRDLLSATEHKPYEIVSVRQLGDEMYAYTFAAVPRAEGRLPVSYTQHVHVRVDGVTRPYTPVALGDDCSFDVVIRAYPGGRFTARLLKKKLNDVVLVRGPSGGVDCEGYGSIVMFCGGTGVAAFLGLIGSMLENDRCESLLRLHYSCRTLDGVIMRETLKEYATYWNCEIFLYLTRENDWSRCSKSFWFNENITEGRISRNVIERISNGQKTLRTLWLVCGNNEFNQNIFNLLKNCDVKEDFIKLFHNNTKDFTDVS